MSWAMNKLWLPDGVRDIHWDAFVLSTRAALLAFRKMVFILERMFPYSV